MLILQLTIHREGRFKRFIVTILMSLSISILIFSYSPEKMGYYALQLPFIIDAIKYIGIYIEPNQDILSSIYHPDYYSIWPTTRFEFSWNRMFVMLRAFFASVVFIHPVIIILNLVSVVSCFIKRKVFQPNCVVSIYFIIILFIHWIGTNTQGSPYVIGNYILHFLFAGSIGSIYGFKELIKRSSMNIAIGMIIILTIVQLCLNIRVLNNNSLVSIYPNYLNEVKELSKVIDDNVPNHEFILPISGSPFYATLGSFYAGNMIELTSIHQNDTYRKFYSDDPTINKLNSLRSLGFWSDELMFNWIENKYDYIILDNGEMANKYRQLVEINFEPVNPPINGYVIYKRK